MRRARCAEWESKTVGWREPAVLRVLRGSLGQICRTAQVPGRCQALTQPGMTQATWAAGRCAGLVVPWVVAEAQPCRKAKAAAEPIAEGAKRRPAKRSNAPAALGNRRWVAERSLAGSGAPRSVGGAATQAVAVWRLRRVARARPASRQAGRYARAVSLAPGVARPRLR